MNGQALTPCVFETRIPYPQALLSMMTCRLLNWFAVTLACVVSGLAVAEDARGDAPPSARAWREHVEDFLAGHFRDNPAAAVRAGKHEFDGQIGDFSREALKRKIKRLHAEREKTATFTDDALSEAQRFERDYLLSEIDGQLFWLEVSGQPTSAPFFYADAFDPDVYVSREYAPLSTRIKAYTKFAANVPAALVQVKGTLQPPLARPAIKIGRRTIGGLADFFEKEIPTVFAPVKDEKSQAEFQAANGAAIRAIRQFDAWLAEQEAEAHGEFALGAEKFGQMLKMTEGVDIPLGRLEAIAKADLERNTAALRAACERFAPGKSVAECIAITDSHKSDDADPVAAAQKQLSGLRQFVVEREVCTIPGTEEALVKRAPSYKAWNFAYINIPGAFEKDLPSVYYISPPDPSWTKEAQAAYVPGRASLLFTSAHEVYPGHFTQYLHAHRAPSKIGQIFVGYAFSEGWAHYTEEMMYEMGLGSGDAEMQIGQLQEALLRNVRFLSAIGLHTQGMTVEESKRMFREVAHQDEGGAEQQALRGTFDPAYLNYTLGKLMIRKLRDDWCATRGGKKAWKQFHDEFLSHGGPPIPLIRRAMLGPDDNGTLF